MVSSVVSMVTTPGIPRFGCAVVIALILFLFVKDILSTSELYRKSVGSSLNMVIGPLLVVFIATVVYKIIEVL
jgi:hypothetical protein